MSTISIILITALLLAVFALFSFIKLRSWSCSDVTFFLGMPGSMKKGLLTIVVVIAVCIMVAYGLGIMVNL